MKKPLIQGKWASRKLWSVIFTLGLVLVNEVFGIGISPDAYWAIVAVVAPYLIGQGIADLRKPE
jgi:hypothetical protein